MRKKTILIIEDDPSFRDVLRATLEQAGFAVIAVGDAADALSQLSHGIDLVLLDFIMPRAVMDGFAFLAEVRAHPELVNTPVIVLSGLGEAVTDAIDPATANALRIVSVIPKPVHLTDLLSAVHAALESDVQGTTPD
jgi:CheY-like chemotaxis protein